MPPCLFDLLHTHHAKHVHGTIPYLEFLCTIYYNQNNAIQLFLLDFLKIFNIIRNKVRMLVLGCSANVCLCVSVCRYFRLNAYHNHVQRHTLKL